MTPKLYNALHSGARGDRKRGSVIVEFALSFPFVIVVLAGMFQFGYAFFAYNSLRNCVHAGARFGSLADFTQGQTAFQTNVKNMTVYGTVNVDGSTRPLVHGLSIDDIIVTSVDTDGVGIPRRITVTVTDYESPSIWRAIRFQNKPRATFTYMGQFISSE